MTAARTRLLLSTAGLAAVWAVVFQARALPFLPTVTAAGLCTGAAGLWCRRALDDPPPLRLSTRLTTLAVLAGGVQYVGGLVAFRVGAALLPAIEDTAVDLYTRLEGPPLVLAILLAAGVVAPLEELFWRGAMQPYVVARTLAARGARLTGWQRWALPLAAAALVYAAWHVVTWKVVLVAAAALGGIVWGGLLMATRSLGATMLTHAVWVALTIAFPVT